MSNEEPVIVHINYGPGSAVCKCGCGQPGGVCEHQWDGPEEFIEYPEGGCSSSATCSRCGKSAMSHSMWFFQEPSG